MAKYPEVALFHRLSIHGKMRRKGGDVKRTRSSHHPVRALIESVASKVCRLRPNRFQVMPLHPQDRTPDSTGSRVHGHRVPSLTRYFVFTWGFAWCFYSFVCFVCFLLLKEKEETFSDYCLFFFRSGALARVCLLCLLCCLSPTV